MKKKEIKHIENLFEEADFYSNPELYNQIIRELNKVSDNEKDALVQYYKGLAYYLNPDEEGFYLEASLKHLNSALKLDNNLFQAELYLGYIYFDLEKSKTAITFFKDFLRKCGQELVDNNQSWRLVNILELITVSYLRQYHYKSFFLFYDTWKLFYYSVIKDDEFYFPKDLIINVANFLKEKGDSFSQNSQDEFKKVSFELIRLIKESDVYEELYKEELEMLQNWDGHFQFNLSYLKV